MTLRYTLVSDGSSDRILLRPLRWLLLHLGVRNPLQGQWADLRLPSPPKGLSERLTTAVRIYPCNLLFVHRDAKAASIQERRAEIEGAVRETDDEQLPPIVCVIPVRMQEAWLLFDEEALRRAAGNPNGQEAVDLPKMADVERLPAPKSLLHEALKTASGLTGRRRKSFSASTSVHRLADLIDDYEPLLQLPAFQELKRDLRQSLREHGWLPSD